MFEKKEKWSKFVGMAIKAGLINPDEEISYLNRVKEIRQLKKDVNATQTEIGSLIGKSQTQLSHWFNGYQKPPLWFVAIMRGWRAGLYDALRIIIPEREKGLRRLKDETVEKIRSLGHNHDRWQMLDGMWQTQCDNRGGKHKIDTCDFAVRILPDKTVETGTMILVRADNIIKREFIQENWRECPYPAH